MKIAYGEYSPTSGRIVVDGTERSFASPHAALVSGVAGVPQEVPLVASLTVAENILLGRLPSRRGRVEWTNAKRRARSVLERLNPGIDPNGLAGRLGPSDRQIVAIARALAIDARILIFDEPTSSLTADQAETLFRIIRQLKTSGVGMVFISQRLQDVREISDRVTVMRDGLVSGVLDAVDADHDTITELMIGRSLQEYFHKHMRPAGDPVLRVHGIDLPGRFQDVSFDVLAGEVVGLAGSVGCGKTDVLRAIFGADRRPSGEIEVSGHAHLPKGPASSIRIGIGMVTGDRKTEGLVLSRTVHENVSMVRNRRLSLLPLRHGSDRRRTDGLIRRLRIQTPSADTTIRKLSGGNQQKVVLAKWLGMGMDLLLLDEPTRGVDVGAKAEIYRIISELADEGVAIVVSSSENLELLGICDRILVMFRGRIVGELDSEHASERQIVSLSTAAGSSQPR
jgi:ABC-type sugar transport system ATPase subunit